MGKVEFEPSIPTRETRVPAGKDWVHEIKHDGYRLIVQREGERVRPFTKNGYDWTDRYPWIVESALKIRTPSFVIDGQRCCSALTVSQILTACIRAGMTTRCGFTPSTSSASRARICASCRCAAAAQEQLQPTKHMPAGDSTPRHIGILAYPGVALLDAVGPQNERATAVGLTGLGEVLEARGKLDEALKSYRDSLAIAERWPPPIAATRIGNAISRCRTKRSATFCGAGQARRGVRELPG